MAITDLVVRSAWERSFHQQLEANLLQKARSLSETLPEITGCSTRPNISDVVHRHATALQVRVTVIDACGNVLADSAAEPEVAGRGTGFIRTMRVEVPHAGLP